MGENVLVTTGRMPVGTAGSAAGRVGWIGLGLVTLISSRDTACWAPAGDTARRLAETAELRIVPASKAEWRTVIIATRKLL
jgi:hypothetical protein